MLRKGLILLAISLTVSVAAQAQQPAGGGGSTGGGNPGGGNTGGGTPGGGNTGGGRPGNNTPNPTRNPQPQERQPQIQRPIFLSGTVVLASGESPVEPIMIKRVCGSQVFPEGYTDSKGRFSFEVGKNTSLAVMDASIGGMSSADGLSSLNGSPFGNAGLGASIGDGVDLSGCSLIADAPGYRSEPITLTRRRSLDRSDVGMIILTPLGGSQAAVVSATSLAAPKKAKSSFEKAVKELGKGSSSDTGKAVVELEKAVAEYPQYAAAWTVLGQVKRQQGDREGAIASFEKALEADQRYIRPYEPLILLHAEQQDWERIAELTDFVLRVGPSDTKMRWYKAVSQFEMGLLDDAMGMIDEIQKDEEGARVYPQTNQIQGLIYAQRGQFVEAASAYRRYLELAPDAAAGEAIKKQLFEWEQLGVI